MIVFIYLLVWSGLAHAFKIPIEDTCLGIKENASSPGTIILKDKFADLIKNHEVFVDKTVLIKKLLEHEDKVILITRPRKWGKSINLEMIKSFVEIHLDKVTKIIVPREETAGYRLFKHGELVYTDGTLTKLKHPLLIAKYKKFLDKHLGQYIVIHASFKSWYGYSYEKIIQRFQILMANMFKEYNYIKKVFLEIIEGGKHTPTEMELAAKHLDMFNQIEENKASILDAKKGLSFLAEILHVYFDRPVIVLIDDYEYPLIDAIVENESTFPDLEKHQFIEFYRDLLERWFKGNEHIEKVILTGTLRLVKEDNIHDSKTIPGHGGIDDRFFEFYGFTRREVDLLMDYRNIPDKLRNDAHKRYGSYESHIPGKFQIYNPQSIISFINSQLVDNYWSETDTPNLEKTKLQVLKFKEPSILKFVSLRVALQSLVYSDEATINATDLHFHAEDYLQLKKLSNSNDTEVTEDKKVSNLIISFLWAHGYFTYSHQSRAKIIDGLELKRSAPNNTLIWFRVPNTEVWMETLWKPKISMFYKDIENDPLLKFQEYSDDPILHHVERFIYDDCNTETKKVLGFVKTMYDNFDPDDGLDKLYYVISHSKLYKHLEIFRSNVHGFPDSVILTQNRLVIVKITFNAESTEEALRQVKQYEDQIKRCRLAKIAKFIAINVRDIWEMCSYTLSNFWVQIDGEEAIRCTLL